MKIAIDTHFVSSEHATGNRTYISELVQAMVAIDSSHEFILYAIEDNSFYRQFDGNERVKVRFVLSSNGIIRNFYSIPKALAEDAPDVVHLLFIMPPFVTLPTVLTVHDLFYVHQQNLSLYRKAIGKFTMWSIPRAEKVITISEYSRQDILRSCKIAPSKVISVPLGIDKRFAPVEDCKDQRGELGIQRDYLLYVGRTEDPRKNLMTLIDAYAALKAENPIAVQLVIAGRHGPGSEILFKRVNELRIGRDVLFPGVVSDADLPALLSGAKLFVYASSFEGFGLPVLEAMACGVPVITSNVTSLPEVAGNAALMVTPGNALELAHAISNVLNDSMLRDKMRQEGIKHASNFSWQRTAQATMNIYEESLL